MSILSRLFGTKKLPDFRDLVDQGAIIIDVRTPQEYDAGSIRGSKNIPLHLISDRADIIQSWGVPVITVCQSGARSSRARAVLRKAGIDAYNGGGWQRFQKKIN